MKKNRRASGSKPNFTQGGFQQTASSKKPSTHIFDSNGDTHLILSTYKDRHFNWEAEKLWLGQERSTEEYLETETKKNKGEESIPPLPPPPTELPEFPVSISTLSGETIDESSAELNGTRDRHEELLEKGKMEPGHADAETNADSSSLQVQDWDYGERSGTLPGQVEIRMLVSGKHLELASSYFEKMFAGPFTEGEVDHSGLRRVTASDWDPEAFNVVLTIIHGYHRDVPRSLSLEMLAKVAMIVDYYECHESIELYADIWLESLKSDVPTVYGRKCILCMFISWVFPQPDMFQKMTRLALRHSGQLIEVEDVPIPSDLLEQIDKARQDTLNQIFSAIYDLLDILQGESEGAGDCSFECSSMLLGVLTKELSKHGILSPRMAQPFYGSSIQGSNDMIKGLKVPEWYGYRDGGYGYSGMGSSYAHSCTIQQRLSPTLERAENKLRVFNLRDFQLAKSNRRP